LGELQWQEYLIGECELQKGEHWWNVYRSTAVTAVSVTLSYASPAATLGWKAVKYAGVLVSASSATGIVASGISIWNLRRKIEDARSKIKELNLQFGSATTRLQRIRAEISQKQQQFESLESEKQRVIQSKPEDCGR